MSVPVRVAPGIRCLVAPNPGPMTGPGTNTWLLGDRDVVVVDPGPAADRHVEAILAACAPGRVAAIWLTHAHPDHACAVPALQARTGAPLVANAVPAPTYQIPGLQPPARALHDGVRLLVDGVSWEALHTPGHASDHFCFLRLEDRGVLTGDVVVGQGTVVVAPPDGDMAAYLASLERLAALRPAVLWPGHGQPIHDASDRLEVYRSHRLRREAQVLAAVRAGAGDVAGLTARLYPHAHGVIARVAARQIEAHLGKLRADGRVRAGADGAWHAVGEATGRQGAP
ncbi:MAG: MBL fold metallo-hydrolase [Candidatus Sericytochromatia bacterium]|nr:MBL fold metallo-hydrolase [Candidatus Sericytochromatia bacterium]